MNSNYNFLETISEKYDNEINAYKLIMFETILNKSRSLKIYSQRKIDAYLTISNSIKRTINKLKF